MALIDFLLPKNIFCAGIFFKENLNPLSLWPPLCIVSFKVSSPRQNQKFSIPPQNGFSPGIFKSDFPLHRPLFQEFSFRIFAKSLDLTTSNYDERVRVLIYALFHHGWRKFWSFDVWNVKKMLWTIKNLPTSLPTRQKSENSNSSPKPFLSRLFEKRLPPRQNPLENPDFSQIFWGEMTLCIPPAFFVRFFYASFLYLKT